MENFMESLRIMGFGMLGIFSVAIALILIMTALTTFFPEESGKKDEK